MSNFIHTQNPYINPFKTLEKYGNYVTVDNTGGGDFTTFTDAINYITNATEDNKYIIDVYGKGVYNEKVTLDKPYIKIRFNSNVLLKSNDTPVLSISNNNEIHENLNIKSTNNTLNTDTLFVSSNCNPVFKDCTFFGSDGAYSLRINEAFVNLINCKCISNYNSIKLENDSILVFSSGEILSGAGYSDIIQDAFTTFKIGVVDYDKSKCVFSGDLSPILNSSDVYFDNTNAGLPDNPKTVQEAIEKLSTQFDKVVHVDNTNTPYFIQPQDKIIYVNSENVSIGLHLPLTTQVIDNPPIQIYCYKYNHIINVYCQVTDKICTPDNEYSTATLNGLYSNIYLRSSEAGKYILDGSTDVTLS